MGHARRCWNYLAPRLARMGTLTTVDRAALEVYCVTYQRWRDTVESINKHGAVLPTHDKDGKLTGYAERPEVPREMKLADLLRKLGRDLGITASARAGLATVAGPAGPKTAEDKLNEKFG
jgi:P27 family predicted phage terminase small subunit